jgi:WD40 repeat protein
VWKKVLTKYLFHIIIALLSSFFVGACTVSVQQQSTNTPIATLRPTTTISMTVTPVPSFTMTFQPTIIPSATSTAFPTFTPTPFPTSTLIPFSKLSLISPANVNALSQIARLAINGVQDIVFNLNSYLLASRQGNSASVWNLITGQQLRSFDGQENLTSLLFNPDGNILALQSDFSITLWNVKTGQLIYRFENEISGVSVAAFSPDGQILGVGGLDNGAVGVWYVGTAKQAIRGLEGPLRQIISVAFSPDGRIFAAGSNFGKVRLWNMRNGALLYELSTASEDDVSRLAFSPDGSKLATATGGYVGNGLIVELWDLKTGSLLYTYEGQNFNPRFSPDGSLLALSTNDGSIILTDAKSGRILQSLPDMGTRTDLAFSMDGRVLASVHNDGSVVFWGVVMP